MQAHVSDTYVQTDITRIIHAHAYTCEIHFILMCLYFDGDARGCTQTTSLGQWRRAVEGEASRWMCPHEVAVSLWCIYSHKNIRTAVKYRHQNIQTEGNLSMTETSATIYAIKSSVSGG